ncbi:MAG: hypothetical protein R2684_11345 [Pyrinomonadaceae bacterium]
MSFLRTSAIFFRTRGLQLLLSAILIPLASLSISAQDLGKSVKDPKADQLRDRPRDMRDMPELGTTNVPDPTPLFDPNGTPGDKFGSAIAVSEDLAVIGAPFDDFNGPIDGGAVTVYRKRGNSWILDGKFTADDVSFSLWFGYTVATDGMRIAVGTIHGSGNLGAIYVFSKDGDAWEQEAKLTASDGQTLDFCGTSLAIDRNRIVTGCSGVDINGDHSVGAAYLWINNGGTWQQAGRVTPSDGHAEDFFGHSIGISENTIVVGSKDADANGVNSSGAVYVYELTVNGLIEVEKLSPTDPVVGAHFGTSVSIEGDRLAIGASNQTNGTSQAQGAVYIFDRSGMNWTQSSKMVPADVGSLDGFGTTVHLTQRALIAGSPLADTNGNRNQGAAYLFVNEAGSWIERAKYSPDEGALEDRFGDAVGVSGGYVIIGSPGSAVGANDDQGIAYGACFGCDDWSLGSTFHAANLPGVGRLGSAVAIDGDTAVVGAEYTDGTFPGQGAAFVLERINGRWIPTATLRAPDGAQEDNFGSSVAIDGDTIVVGAIGDLASVFRRGSAYVFRRAGCGWEYEAKLVPDSFSWIEMFGYSLAIEDDLIVVGGPQNSDFQQNQGAAYLYRRTGTGWNQETRFTDPAGMPGDRMGTSVDIDRGRVFVGAVGLQFAGHDPFAGAVYVYEHNGKDWSNHSILSVNDQYGSPQFGWDIAASGDTLLGSGPDYSQDADFAGAAWFLRFDSSAWIEQTRVTPNVPQVLDSFGKYAVDVDGTSAMIAKPAVLTTFPERPGTISMYSLQDGNWQEKQVIGAPETSKNMSSFGRDAAISGGTMIVGDPNFDDGEGAVYIYEQGPQETTPGSPLTLRGRVTSAIGSGIPNTSVCFRDANGNARTARTNQLGFFNFQTANVGRIVTIHLANRERRFRSRRLYGILGEARVRILGQ